MITNRLTAQRLRRMLGNWRGAGHSYLELSESIELLVRDGALSPGTALPAERTLAEALGVSRTTIAAGYRHLRDTGLAQSRQGSATVICAQAAAASAHDTADSAEIDLSIACPQAWSGVQALAAQAMEHAPDLFLSPGYDTIGRPALREAVAARYSARGLPTAPEQVMITLGAQHAIYLIARTLLGRGDRCVIESPSYPHAREALAATGAIIGELPIGHSGYEAEALLDVITRASPRLAYLIPDHHNPTGVSMPADLRTRVIAQLGAQGGVVIADETTAELTLGGPRTIVPFAASAQHAHQQDAIVTIGSLGKTVWGGLRIGWIRATPELIDRFEAARSLGDLGTGTWEQVVAELALARYDEILDDRSRQLTARHRALVDALHAQLPDWRVSPATGGASAWVDLGEHRSTALCRESARRGVRLVPGPRFGSPGAFERYVRMPFTAPESDLVEAVRRIGDAWRADAGVAMPPIRRDSVI